MNCSSTVIRRCREVIVALCACAWMFGAQAQPDNPAAPAGKANPDDGVIFDSDPKSWARVKHIVPPKYPQDALEKGIGGIVDVEVLIDVVGYAKEIRSISSTPKNPAFEEATLAVVKRWVFNVPQTQRCEPYETAGNARLTFAVIDGAPNIALSHRAAPVTSRPVVAVNKMLWVNSMDAKKLVKYPLQARRAGAQANVNALMTVNGKGELIDVEITHVLAHKAFKQEFSNAVMDALKDAKFVGATGTERIWRYCVPFVFRLTDP